MSYSGKWTEGIGLKLWKNIRLDINKVTQSLAREYEKSAAQQLNSWKNRVYDVISDPLPESEWHRRRDPSRLFPHMNTGKQRNSINTGVKFKVTGQGNYSITGWTEIEVKYAEFTNQGYRKRGDGIKPQWIGWLDRVFYGHDGFNSVADVFDLLTLERAAL